MSRYILKAEHRAKGPAVGPEGIMVCYSLMLPPSLKDWLHKKGPKYVRRELLKVRGKV